jgi:predicted extracellular nuclease
MMKRVFFSILALVSIGLSTAMGAGMQITEWMYKGTDGEFVEFTNTGSTAIDMTGWSYSDSARTAGDVILSSFGTVATGESVILTETAIDTFRAAWGLNSSVKIIGGNLTDNLGRSDEINLYDASNALVDRLTFDDQTGEGPRTQNLSCSIPASDYGLTTASSAWVLSSVGDIYGAWTSTGGDIGSPGVVPEPATMLLLGLGIPAILRRRSK